MSDNEPLWDVFKKEVIEKSEDPLKIDEKGEMFCYNHLFSLCQNKCYLLN